MSTWDNQVDQIYDELSTDELKSELSSLRFQIGNEFKACDMFENIGQKGAASQRRQLALALTKRSARISSLLEKRN